MKVEDMLNLPCLLAQAQPGAPSPGSSFVVFALMVAMIAFMLLTMRSQRKREKREREEMHARLAKNDRVLTIGGIIGTVVSVKDQEVVVKVDESTNAKLTLLRTAIQRILTDDPSAETQRRV
ncbi:MAG: preprotein translocase subunit YajC [Planctomycetes bacterium]|nr:preprotein translocase subunit YajC [Planctomycetota bacterium]